jgi:predicted nucleic acid-binding protein
MRIYMGRINVYADTNVYIDIFDDRSDKRRYKYDDWADFALEFLRRVKEKQYKLVISDWVFDEIKKVRGTDKELQELLKMFAEDDILIVERTREDETEAAKLSKNYPDALHVVLAKKSNCVYLVTRNIDDFMEFRDIIKITLPRFL